MNSRGKLSTPSVPCPGPDAKEERSIDLLFQEAFSSRAQRLPAKYRNSNRPRHSRRVVLDRANSSASLETAIVQYLKWQRPRYNEDIGSDISRHHRQPRHGRRGEIIEKRSPSQRVDELSRAVSAAIGTSARRHRDQPSHPPLK